MGKTASMLLSAPLCPLPTTAAFAADGENGGPVMEQAEIAFADARTVALVRMHE